MQNPRDGLASGGVTDYQGVDMTQDTEPSQPDDVTFWHYDNPIHDTQVIPADPGVTPGYIALQDMGRAWSIPFAVLTAPDGSQVFEQTGDAVEVTVVDDAEPTP